METNILQNDDEILNPDSKLFKLINSHDERLRALIKSEILKQYIPYTSGKSGKKNSQDQNPTLIINSKLPKEICVKQSDSSPELFFALDYEKISPIASLNALIYSDNSLFILNSNELEKDVKDAFLRELKSKVSPECQFYHTFKQNSHQYFVFTTQIKNSDLNFIKLDLRPIDFNRLKQAREIYLGFGEKRPYWQRTSKLPDKIFKISPKAIELRITISKEIQNFYPDISNHNRIYLYQKREENENEFIPYNWGTIYQYEFQLYGLQSLWFKSNSQTKSLHEFLSYEENTKKSEPSELETKWDEIKLQLPINIDNKQLNWDKKQQESFEKIFNKPCLTALNGIAGSGKTTVMNACWNSLKDKKILVLAHDHKIVDSIMQKYIDANPKVIFYRIGQSPKAREGAMAEHHYLNKERDFQNQTIQRVGDNIQNLERSNRVQDKEKISILKDWQKFLNDKDGKQLFEQIKFNSARAIFCTIGGIEHYNKIGLLHEFLPFDYLFLDEASMIDLPQLFHATQFCRSRVIAGDKFLIQPMQSEDNYDLRSINALQELEKSYPNRDDIFVTFISQYRIFNKLFTIIAKELFGEWQKEKGIILDNRTIPSNNFSVNDNQGYLSINPLVFIDTTLFGKQAKQYQKTNQKEIEIIIQLLTQLNQKQEWKNARFQGPCKIWITSLFDRQIDKLKEEIEPKILHNDYKNLDIEICKVREFTGNEKEVVIWSLCVAPEYYFTSKNRSKPPKVDLGPLSRADLIYDLITRSKSMLYIVGVKQIFTQICDFMMNIKASEESVFNYQKFGKMLSSILIESKIINAITRPPTK